MKNGWILAALFVLGVNSPALADEPYKAARGDTLWGISGKFWSEPPKWPVLWSKNPQIHNPHWIEPGDPIYLDGKKPEEGTVEEIRLQVEVLTPPEAATAAEPKEAASADDAGKGAENGAKAAAAKEGSGPVKIKGAGAPSSSGQFTLKSGRILDYISPKKVERLGTLRAIVEKNAFTESEELFVDPAGPDKIAAGDMLAIIDDSREILHPVDNLSRGYQVRLLGMAEVLKVENNVGKIRILFSNDTVVPGYGVMLLREPPSEIAPSRAKAAFEGVVLAGDEKEATLFGSDDVIFLDKGAAQGAAKGNIISIPFQTLSGGAEGLVVETDKPTAVAVIVSAEENTSTAFVLKSRYTVTAGQRFTAVSDSP